MIFFLKLLRFQADAKVQLNVREPGLKREDSTLRDEVVFGSILLSLHENFIYCNTEPHDENLGFQ
jgi:hypothetical protein